MDSCGTPHSRLMSDYEHRDEHTVSDLGDKTETNDVRCRRRQRAATDAATDAATS